MSPTIKDRHLTDNGDCDRSDRLHRPTIKDRHLTDKEAVLVLADGKTFTGYSTCTNTTPTVGEVIFNTSHTGYQEVLTDPSYTSQIVVFTNPQIGNVGVNSDDEESDCIKAEGLAIRQLSPIPSNWRHQTSLTDYLRENNTGGIHGIDTRALTTHIRTKGAQGGCILTAGNNKGLLTDDDREKALKLAREFESLAGKDLARKASVTKVRNWTEPGFTANPSITRKSPPSSVSENGNSGGKVRVVVLDLGCKRAILQHLVDFGAQVTLVPAQTCAAEILAMQPQGVLLSNGPGDPQPCTYAIDTVKTLKSKGIPIMGICLGHQILALALGAKTFKMKFGHHGTNHPVQDLATGKVFITSQNHGFAVADDGLPTDLDVTHRSLFDATIQGIRHKDLPIFGIQGHPEASPGPTECAHLLQDFVTQCKSVPHPTA